MSDINSITLTGNAGGDAEWVNVNDKTDLAKVNLAVNMYAGPDKDEETMWVTLNFWGARSKVAEFIKSGMALTVQGKLRIRTVGEGDDKKWYTSVDVDDVKLPPKGSSGGGGSGNGGGRRKSGGASSRQRGTRTGNPKPNVGRAVPF